MPLRMWGKSYAKGKTLADSHSSELAEFEVEECCLLPFSFSARHLLSGRSLFYHTVDGLGYTHIPFEFSPPCSKSHKLHREIKYPYGGPVPSRRAPHPFKVRLEPVTIVHHSIGVRERTRAGPNVVRNHHFHDILNVR